MRVFNILRFAIFSFAGSLSAMEDVSEGMFGTWGEVFQIIPGALFAFSLLLAMSVLSAPLAAWQPFNLSKFLLSQHQPHIFMAFLGAIFFTGGLLGALLAMYLGSAVTKYSGLLMVSGFSVALPAILACIYVARRKSA